MPEFDYESLIAEIPDYPEPGVLFKDITPLIGDGEGLAACVDAIAERFADAGVTKVAGTEARGFLLGAPVAYKMGVGFVPVRKPGKLPREVYSQEYELEYGTNTVEIHQDAISEDDVVLLVDDLIATGGTAKASVQLIQRCGAKVAGMAFLLELTPFKPREILGQVTDADFYSLVQVDTY